MVCTARMRRRHRISRVLPSLVLMGASLPSTLAWAEELICVADRVVTRSEAPVAIRAEVANSAQTLDQALVRWTAESGAIASSPDGARWVAGTTPGYVRIRGSLPSGAGGPIECTVRVYVAEATLSLDETRKYFLVPGEDAPAGFASLSYLLLGGHFDTAAEPDRRAVVRAFLGRIEELSVVDDVGSPGTKNLLMIPVLRAPPPVVSEDPHGDTAVDWVLRNFDYPRAQTILARAVEDYGTGPYIVSTRVVETDGEAVTESLVQDMTGAHRDVAALWVDLHVTRSTEEEDWSSASFSVYATHVLNALSVFSEAVPAAVQSVGNAAGWVVQIAKLNP